MIQNIIDSRDIQSLMKAFKELIRRSYGVKSQDGKHFVKNDEIFEEFVSTPAYSNLIMEFLEDTDKAVEFVNGIMPKPANTSGVSVVPDQA